MEMGVGEREVDWLDSSSGANDGEDSGAGGKVVDLEEEARKEREIEEACAVNRALCNLELSTSFLNHMSILHVPIPHTRIHIPSLIMHDQLTPPPRKLRPRNPRQHTHPNPQPSQHKSLLPLRHCPPRPRQNTPSPPHSHARPNLRPHQHLPPHPPHPHRNTRSRPRYRGNLAHRPPAARSARESRISSGAEAAGCCC